MINIRNVQSRRAMRWTLITETRQTTLDKCKFSTLKQSKFVNRTLRSQNNFVLLLFVAAMLHYVYLIIYCFELHMLVQFSCTQIFFHVYFALLFLCVHKNIKPNPILIFMCSLWIVIYIFLRSFTKCVLNSLVPFLLCFLFVRQPNKLKCGNGEKESKFVPRGEIVRAQNAN